jgi:hypothetical protein
MAFSLLAEEHICAESWTGQVDAKRCLLEELGAPWRRRSGGVLQGAGRVVNGKAQPKLSQVVVHYRDMQDQGAYGFFRAAAFWLT